MRLCGVLLITLAGLACERSAFAEDDLAKTREKLAQGVEASPATLRMREEDAPELMAIFGDPNAPRYVRLRALSALSHMKRDDVRVFFTTLVTRGAGQPDAKDGLDPRLSTMVLRRAIEALVHIDPSDRTIDVVAPFVAHESVQVRSAVAKALSRVRTEKAVLLAQKQMLAERSELVRRLLLEVKLERVKP